jgi:hypothetical protein
MARTNLHAAKHVFTFQITVIFNSGKQNEPAMHTYARFRYLFTRDYTYNFPSRGILSRVYILLCCGCGLSR